MNAGARGTTGVSRVPTAVLVSGSGTNLQAVIDASKQGQLPLDLRLVVSSKAEAYALKRARRAGIPSAVLRYDRRRETRSEYALRVASAVSGSGAQLVLLLGWMHVLAQEFLDSGFEGVLNLHPAYLPEEPGDDVVVFADGTTTPVFRGAHALRDALAAKAPHTGASLIQITGLVDRGPLLARRPMQLHPHEDQEAALERLHAVEREVVREGILRWIAARSRSTT
jgi:folate-dependent phosphoribosylglycinamide formyltransferase PurN